MSLLPAPAPSQTRVWLAALGLGAAVAVGWMLRGVLVSLLLAFLLAWALDPVVRRLEAAKVPRGLAALAVLFAAATGVTAVLLVALPYFGEQFRAVVEQFPAKFEAFHLRAEDFFRDRFHVQLPHTWGDLTDLVADAKNAPDMAKQAALALFGTLDVLLLAAGSMLVPVFALWLLVEYDRVVRQCAQLVPRRWAGLVTSVAREIDRTLGGWLRGQLIACLVLAALYAVGLSFAGIRLAIPIGILTGLLAFVPYVGFGGGLALALTMAVVEWNGIHEVLAVVVAMLAVQLLDAIVITPRIVGRSVGLHPLEVLVTMTAAGTLFGFLGVLLAVPLGATTKIVLRRATRAYLRSGFYRAPPKGPYVTPLPVPASERVPTIPPPEEPEIAVRG